MQGAATTPVSETPACASTGCGGSGAGTGRTSSSSPASFATAVSSAAASFGVNRAENNSGMPDAPGCSWRMLLFLPVQARPTLRRRCGFG